MEISTVAIGINTLTLISLFGWLVFKILTDLNQPKPRGATRRNRPQGKTWEKYK